MNNMRVNVYNRMLSKLVSILPTVSHPQHSGWEEEDLQFAAVWISVDWRVPEVLLDSNWTYNYILCMFGEVQYLFFIVYITFITFVMHTSQQFTLFVHMTCVMGLSLNPKAGLFIRGQAGMVKWWLAGIWRSRRSPGRGIPGGQS